MNFEDWLKRGLDDSPGGDWMEERIDKVAAKSRQRRVSRNRRWGAPMRTASTVAAAVVLAGGVIGGVLWSGQHNSTARPPSKGHHVGGPNSTNTGNKVQNPNSSTTTQAATTQPTNVLMMYQAGSITAHHAIPWPGLQKSPIPFRTMAKVVQVPFTSAVTTPTRSAPKTIQTSLPVQVEGKLTAYFVQMNATTAFYLLGPPGMKGKAELAADGSFDVYLHNAHATIEVDTSGASPVMTDTMAAPFFAAARTAAAQDQPSATSWGPLAPATTTHPNANTAYFSFATKSGQNVAGWNDYLPNSNLPSAQMMYESDASDWSYAPYILEGSVNLLNNVIAPQIGGTVVKPKFATVHVGGQSLTLPNSNGNAVQTPQGIAWVWQPSMVRKFPASSGPTNTIPAGSYGIAFGTPQAGQTPITAQVKDNIPSLQVVDADNNVYYAFPQGLAVTGKRWLWYTVAWAALGMNQPANNELHVYDLQTHQDTVLTSFLAAGGSHFAVGSSGHFLVYDSSHVTYANASSALVHSVWLVNLATASKTQLPSSDLVKDQSVPSGTAVKADVAGKTLTIPLRDE